MLFRGAAEGRWEYVHSNWFFIAHLAASAMAFAFGLLMLVMWGICSGFIHGVGFDPYGRLWRTIFHPLGGWLLMLLGYAILWQAALQ